MCSSSNGRRADWPGFRSFKTSQPIKFIRRWHRYGLMLLTLDPEVDEILPLSQFNPASDPSALFVETRSAMGSRICAMMERESLTPPPGVLMLYRADVLREPRLSNIKAIWSAADSQTDLTMRMTILSLLEQSGGAISLGDARLARHGSNRPFDALLHMVLQGMLEMDLSSDFDLTTPVRIASRRRSDHGGQST